MRVAIDIPDPLHHQIEETAAVHGRTLNDWVIEVLQAKIHRLNTSSPPTRVHLPIVESKELSYDLTSERLAEIMDEENCGSVI